LWRNANIGAEWQPERDATVDQHFRLPGTDVRRQEGGKKIPIRFTEERRTAKKSTETDLEGPAEEF